MKPEVEMKLEDGRDLITMAAAAKMMGLTVGRISHFQVDGRLASVRLNEFPGRTFVIKEEVKNFMKQRKGVPGTKPPPERQKPFKIPW